MKILIVDDNESLLDSIAFFLSRLGYYTETAGNGKEALEKFNGDHFDFLLTDLNMPEMDGISLAKNVLKSKKNIKIVFMSAEDFPNDLNLFLKLKKPFGVDELLSVLDYTDITVNGFCS